MASKAANKAKYQYNKKYQEAYWERRAQREAAAAETEPKKKLEVFVDPSLFDAIDTVCVSVCRADIPDDTRYIKALETANKTLGAENRRLVSLLRKYQEIVNIGVNALIH